MKPEDLDRLAKYVEAAVIPRFNTDRRKYPIYAGRLGKLYLDVLAKELFDDIQDFLDEDRSIKELARIFSNPTRIMRMAHTILAGMKMGGATLEKQRQIILTLLDIIKAMKYGSEFCEDGRNLIFSPSQVAATLEGVTLSDADNVSARSFQRLCAVLWAYAETSYFVCHGIAMEAHGPYAHPTNGPRSVLVRDFFYLRPTDLWDECGEVPFENIRIVAVHKGLDIYFDAFDNLYVRSGNLVTTLEKYAVLAGADSLVSNKLGTLCSTLNSVILKLTKKVDTWSEREIARKYMEIFWYQTKPLKDALSKSWRPPRIVMDRVESAEIPPHSDKRPTKEAIKQEMSLI